MHVHQRHEKAWRAAATSLESPAPRRAANVHPDELTGRSPDAGALADGQEQRLLFEAALRRLSPVEAWVLRERFGLTTVAPELCLLVRQLDPAGAIRSGAHPIGDPGDPSRRPTYFHRTYSELGRDCGLSLHRIRQVEAAALEKLRDVLGSDFNLD